MKKLHLNGYFQFCVVMLCGVILLAQWFIYDEIRFARLVAADARARMVLARVTPVVTGLSPSEWRASEQGVSAWVAGDKPEALPGRTCKIKEVRWSARVSGDTGIVDFLGETGPPRTRPPGPQSFKRWMFYGAYPGDTLNVSSIHICAFNGEESPVETFLGAWRVPSEIGVTDDR